MDKTPFIAVEGPIGIGKTSLAKAIAKHLSYELLQEIVDENPFLSKFYSNIEEWSFQLEMFFLCNRYKQLGDIEAKFLSNHLPVVSDYHIFKNLIFSKRTLSASDYHKYLKIYDILTKDKPQPSMVIYLNAHTDTIMERIAMRGRDFEQQIERSYISQLSTDYHHFIEHFQATHPNVPVLHFNGDALDFVKNKEDLSYILHTLDETLKGVTQNGFKNKI